MKLETKKRLWWLFLLHILWSVIIFCAIFFICFVICNNLCNILHLSSRDLDWYILLQCIYFLFVIIKFFDNFDLLLKRTDFFLSERRHNFINIFNVFFNCNSRLGFIDNFYVYLENQINCEQKGLNKFGILNPSALDIHRACGKFPKNLIL